MPSSLRFRAGIWKGRLSLLASQMLPSRITTARYYKGSSNNIGYKSKSDLQWQHDYPVSPEESCFEEERVEAEITADYHQLQVDQDQEEKAWCDSTMMIKEIYWANILFTDLLAFTETTKNILQNLGLQKSQIVQSSLELILWNLHFSFFLAY